MWDHTSPVWLLPETARWREKQGRSAGPDKAGPQRPPVLPHETYGETKDTSSVLVAASQASIKFNPPEIVMYLGTLLMTQKKIFFMEFLVFE